MDEYISKKSLINHLVTKFVRLDRKGVDKVRISSVINEVELFPAAEVESTRSGEWEWFEEWSPSTTEHPAECDDCGWRCGRCKRPLEDIVGGYWDNMDEKPKLAYCPNCGVCMDKKEKQ